MFSRIAGIFLIGIVVKFMDDFVDQELDSLMEQKNIAKILGRGILPYTLVLVIIALFLNFKEAAALFLASYIIGMTHNGQERLPSSLKSWQESMLALLLSILLTSTFETLAALNLILLLQFIDDLFDYGFDNYIKNINLIKMLGLIPAVLVMIILVLIPLKLFPLKFLYFMVATVMVYLTVWGIIKLDSKYNASKNGMR